MNEHKTIELSVYQAAELLGVSPTRVRDEMRQGRMPSYRKPFGTWVVVTQAGIELSQSIEAFQSGTWVPMSKQVQERMAKRAEMHRRDLLGAVLAEIHSRRKVASQVSDQVREIHTETMQVLEASKGGSPSAFFALVRCQRLVAALEAQFQLDVLPAVLPTFMPNEGDARWITDAATRQVCWQLAVARLYDSPEYNTSIRSLLATTSHLIDFVPAVEVLELQLLSKMSPECAVPWLIAADYGSRTVRSAEKGRSISAEERAAWPAVAQRRERMAWYRLVYAAALHDFMGRVRPLPMTPTGALNLGDKTSYERLESAALVHHFAKKWKLYEQVRKKRQPPSPALRQQIYSAFEAAGRVCGLCKQPVALGEATAIHHIRPVAAEGITAKENLVVVHAPCNTALSAYDGWIVRREYDSYEDYYADMSAMLHRGYRASVRTRTLPGKSGSPARTVQVVTYRGRPQWDSMPAELFAPEHRK